MSGRQNDPMLFWGSVLTSRLSDVALLYPPSDMGTHDDHRWALLDEIDAMSVALARLKERHNFIHGKLKLPTEVLEHIFAHAALNEIPGQGKTANAESFRPDRGFDTKAAYACALQAERKTYEILGWMKVTHVCRAWRAIALAGANRWLWTTIDMGRLSATGMRNILERSHPLPITLTMTLSLLPREIRTFHVLHDPQYLPRLKSARIVYDERIHHRCLRDTKAVGQAIISTFVSHSSPTLEFLAIEHDEADDYVLKLPVDVPMPLLRHLKLKDAQFSSIMTYPQLTHLEVTTGSQEDFMLVSIDKFIVFLRGSPNLQVLRLTRSSSWATCTAQNMEEQHVDLPHLTELYLKGTIRDCARLGCFLNTPDSCSIVIELPGSNTQCPHEILGPMLRRWIPSPVRLDIYSGDDGISDGVKAWHTDGGGFHDSPPRLHLVCLSWRRLNLPQLMPKQFSSWETIYSSVSLEHLVHFRVHVRSDRKQRPVSWRRLLQGATAARHVRVEGCDAVDDLISLLSSASPPTQKPHKQDDQTLYPGLQSLSVRSFDHVALVEKHGLRDCLQARKDAGVGDAMMNVQFEFPDGMVPPGFEASLAELNSLATFQIKTYH